MKRVAIIGLGKISAPHIQGLLNNKDKFKIVAVCDINGDLKTVANVLDVPFYESHLDIAKLDNVDIALVLTPPATHHEIAKDLLLSKKNVLVEKPGVLKIDDLYDLVATAKEHDVFFDVMFHWFHGSEVIALDSMINNFGDLKKIEATAFDPYTLADQKTIAPDCVHMSGAWFDSGINILSMLARFVDVIKFKLVSEYKEMDTVNNLPIYIERTYDCNGLPIIIKVDWRENKNHKFTNFFFDSGTLFLHHTAQEIWLNSTRLGSYYNDHRLETHYTNLFRDLELGWDNVESTIEIHKTLLQELRKQID